MEAAELYKKSKREAISELLHEIEYVKEENNKHLFAFSINLNDFVLAPKRCDNECTLLQRFNGRNDDQIDLSTR